MKKRSLLLLVVVLIMSLAMFGCGADEPAAQAPAGDQAAAPAAPAAETHKWVVQSYGASNTVSHEMCTRICDAIGAMTGGNIAIDCLPAGSVVALADALDATSAGTLDAAVQYFGGNTGQIPAIIFWCGIPGFYMDGNDARIWSVYGDGDKLLDQVIKDAGYNLQTFSTGLISDEIFMHSKKAVRTVEDLKGMKVRGGGLWAEVVTEFGATPVSVAGGEVYTSLERGVVDAIEWGSPGVNIEQGFTDIAKYVMVPQAHQSWTTQGFIIYQDTYDKLSDAYKAIVKYACNAQWAESSSMQVVYDAKAWKEFRAMHDSGKIEIINVGQAMYDEFNAVSVRLIEEKAKNDANIAMVYENIKELKELIDPYYEDFTPAK